MGIRFTHLAKVTASIIATALLTAVGGCGAGTTGEPQTPQTSPQQQQTSGPITVVASINQWGSLAKQIGGDDVNVTSILSATNVDAHDFEPQTADVAKIAKAQIVIVNGAGYDTWATKSMDQQSTGVSAAQIVGAMEGDNPHLWFSKDARNGMAKELVNVFSKALPDKKADFEERYDEWQQQEKDVEQQMNDFSANHKDASYAATEAVAYYLMSDMGFTDKTPKGYATSSAAEAEAAPADLREFQKLLEDKDVDLLVNNTQEASDATNMITGTAGRSGIPVFDVSEQMPKDASDLTEWIGSLVDTISGYLTPCTDDSDDADDSDDVDDSDDADTSSGKPSGDSESESSVGTTCKTTSTNDSTSDSEDNRD